MKKISIWEKDIKRGKIKKLQRNSSVDILIIGGGITGLSSAYYLKDSSLQVALVEANFVGSGVTAKTTGKINYLQQTIYSDLASSYSLGIAKKYLESQREAIKNIVNIIQKENISCDLEKVSSYVFTDKENEIAKLRQEKRTLEALGIHVKEHDSIDLPLSSLYALSVDDTYVFHPLKYLYQLKNIVEKKITIYEKTKIIQVKRKKDYYVCKTSDNCFIQAKKVLFCNHYPFFLIPYFFPMKCYIEKSYITASTVKSIVKKNYINEKNPCKSIRFHQDQEKKYLLFLSQSHNLCNDLDVEKNYNQAIDETKRLSLNPKFVWSNDDLITVDGMPYIGYIKKGNNQLFIATGYNTWGMTNGTLAGKILSDIILEKHNSYQDLFSPYRSMFLSHLLQCTTIVGSNLKSYVVNKLLKQKSWYNGKVFFSRKKGKNLATVIDEDGCHTVINKCPHMGCSLLYNSVDKTWDCPCHASRFSIDGKCIKGPSCYDITFEKDNFR